MDLNFWKSVPCDTWYVLLSSITALLSGVLALSSGLARARGPLSRSGFLRPAPEGYSFGYLRAALVIQLAIFGLFSLAGLLSIQASLNPPPERLLWVDYNSAIRPFWIGLNVLFAGATVLCSTLGARRVPAGEAAGEAVRAGRRNLVGASIAWIVVSLVELPLVGADYERYKSLILIAGFATAGYLMATTTKKASLTQVTKWTAIALFVSFLTEPFLASMAVAIRIPSIQRRIPELVARAETERARTQKSDFVLEGGGLIRGTDLWYRRGETGFVIYLSGGVKESLSYSSATQRWRAEVFTAW